MKEDKIDYPITLISPLHVGDASYWEYVIDDPELHSGAFKVTVRRVWGSPE